MWNQKTYPATYRLQDMISDGIARDFPDTEDSPQRKIVEWMGEYEHGGGASPEDLLGDIPEIANLPREVYLKIMSAVAYDIAMTLEFMP